MIRKKSREKVNLVSLVVGIVLIVFGLAGSAITIPTGNAIIIAPIVSLILGAILALLGGLRKW